MKKLETLKKWFQLFKQFIPTTLPVFIDDEDNRKARILHTIGIVAFFCINILIIYRLLNAYLLDIIPLLALNIAVYLSLLLLVKKKLNLSAFLGLWSMLFFVGYQSLFNYGLHDVVIFSLPIILIVGGLILNKRNYIILVSTSIALLTLIGHLQITETVKNLCAEKVSWSDLLDLDIMLLITAITVWYLSDSLRKTIVRLQKSEKEILKKAEELSISEKRYRLLFENANEAIFILSYDKFIGCNSMALKMFGCNDSKDIIGYYIYDFGPDYQPDNRNSKEKIVDLINRALYTSSQRFYWKFQRCDKTLFDAEVSLSKLDYGGETLLQAMIMDVTARLEAENSLRKAEERLRNIIENTPNLFYICNTNYEFTYLSPQAKEIFELDTDEKISSFRNVLSDNPANKIALEISQKAIETGIRQPPYELEIISKKGNKIWLELQETPIVQNNKTVSLVGVATDITKRKWAERALQASEKKYRDIFALAPIGIYQSSRSGKLLNANISIAKLLGYSSIEEFIGCNLEDIYYNKKDMEHFIAQHDIAGENVTLSFETQWKKKNGEVIWVLLTVHDVRDKSGQVLYYEGFVFDITARKQVEEALSESEERYRLLVENSTDLVAEINTLGEYLYVSPNVKTILDYRPVDLIGTNIISKVYNKDKELIYEILNKNRGSATYRYRDRNGMWHWFESSCQSYSTSSGEKRIVIVSRDITERKKAEQEIEISRKQLQYFTEHLEHVLEEERKGISREMHDELGQLLTILKFDLGWIRLEVLKGNINVTDKIDSMIESVNECLSAVKRISKEIRPPQLDALGLSGAIQWDIEQAERKIGIKGNLTISPSGLELRGKTATVLYRIFREALTNVVRHSQAKNIYVNLEKKETSLILTIRDDGRGITKKELKGETSLGLVGMRERARIIGGTITINGKTGEGTTIKVEVPIEKIKESNIIESDMVI